jgi:hypothetical protein
VNVTSSDPARYVLDAAAVARTTQLPRPVNVNSPVDEFTEHVVVELLTFEYVIAPGPLDVATAG